MRACSGLPLCVHSNDGLGACTAATVKDAEDGGLWEQRLGEWDFDDCESCTSLAVARKPEVCTWAPARRDRSDGSELALNSNASRCLSGALTAEGRAAGSTLDLTHFGLAQCNERCAADLQRDIARAATAVRASRRHLLSAVNFNDSRERSTRPRRRDTAAFAFALEAPNV
jgi:hypothetical protein